MKEKETKEKEAEKEKKKAEKVDEATLATMTEEEKAAALAMKALRDTKTGACMTEMTRNEAHRPHGRPEGQPSRHDSVTEPAAMLLMFNCNRCSFKLAKGDITTIPESEAIDLRSTKSMQTIGRCKVSPAKGTEFIDRVDFPNEWKVGDEHGLIHDGLQVRSSSSNTPPPPPCPPPPPPPPLTHTPPLIMDWFAGRRRARATYRLEGRE